MEHAGAFGAGGFASLSCASASDSPKPHCPSAPVFAMSVFVPLCVCPSASVFVMCNFFSDIVLFNLHKMCNSRMLLLTNR